MKIKTYYAVHFPCGKGVVNANTGRPMVTVYAFESKLDRDAEVESYLAPNHCPQACVIKAASHSSWVRDAKRRNDVLIWMERFL